MRKLFYLFAVILILSFSLITISGCSNKSAPSGGAVSTNNALAAETVAQNTTSSNQPGALEAKIYWPKLPGGKLILPETKHIIFTITGQGLTSERTAQVAYGTTTVSITNLPVGTKTAEVKAIDGNGATLTHRIVSFTITSGTTTSTDIVLGISITDNGYIPQSVKISPNDTLLFVNSSAATSHSATSDDGTTFDSGTLAAGATYPKQFTSAGVFNYHDSQNTNLRGTITVYSPPTISSLSASSGNAGDSITITGTNFGASQGVSTLTFNGITAVATSWSNTSIVCKVPQASTGNIVAIVNNQASNGYKFTINSSYISAISPDNGLVGTAVTINGYNFGAAQGSSKVSFNGKDVASYSSWSATKIVCSAPSGATTGPITVTVNDLVSNGVSFTVLAPAYFGTGADGALPLASSFNINTNTNSQGGREVADGINFSVTINTAAGQDQITLASAPNGLAVGDEILIINLKNASGGASAVGQYETVIIKSINVDTSTLTLKTTLINTYDGETKKIMVQRIPQYSSITLDSGATLTANAWDGTKGGVVFVRCKNTLSIANTATISMTQKGFLAGVVGGNAPEQYDGFAAGGGNGVDGNGTTNGGAGGSGSITGGPSGGAGNGYDRAAGAGGTLCGGGGGGGGSGGCSGGGAAAYSPGAQPTDSGCSKIYLGGGGAVGGGGGGQGDTGGGGGNKNGTGGTGSGVNGSSANKGAGIIVIYASTVTINSGGSIVANAGNGGAGGNGYGKGTGAVAGGGGGSGGGGAAGGAIYVGYQTLTNGTITANGGNGGNGGSGGETGSGGGGAAGTGGVFGGDAPTAGGYDGAHGAAGGGGAGGPAGNVGVTKLQSL